MDMTRHLRRWLNDKVLREMGDTYQGRIVSVTEEQIKNRFKKYEIQLEPVITFEDGWRLIPNITQRKGLIEMFGSETDDWIGCEVIVFRHRGQKTDSKTGLTKEITEKRVRLPIQYVDRKRA
jgi:hypothetical protein